MRANNHEGIGVKQHKEREERETQTDINAERKGTYTSEDVARISNGWFLEESHVLY